MPVTPKKFRKPLGNKRDRASVVNVAASVAFKAGFKGKTQQ
jgi:hypothetical protein